MLNRYKKLLALIIALVMLFTISMPENVVIAAGEDNLNNVKTIQILSTTDLHGKFTNFDYALNSQAAGGLNQIALQVKKAKKENPNTLVVDNGDTIQGNYNSMFLTDEFLDNNINPMVLAMSKIGYDTMSFGNHEFNFGMNTLNKISGQFENEGITTLCGNLYKDGQRVFKPYTVKEVDGVRVAVIGVVAPNITNWDKDKLIGYDATNPAEEVKKILSEIKAKNEADIYVVTAHMGKDSENGNGDSARDIAELNPEVSLIIAGHSHVSIPEEKINGVLVTQPKNAGEELSKAELKVAKDENGNYKVVDSSSSCIKFTKTSETDSELDEALSKYDEMAKNDGKKVIGTLKDRDLADKNEVKNIPQSYVSDQGVTDLINEVQLYYSDLQLKKIGIDTSKINHVSGAAMLSDGANLYKGDITKSDLSNIYKFDNKLYTVKTNGKQLKKYLEWTAGLYENFEDGDLTVSLNPEFRTYLYDTLTGVNYDINISKDAGNRIENLTFPNGNAVKDDDVIYLTVNDYRLNSCLSKVLDMNEVETVYKSTDDSLSDVREMIADYIINVKGGTISRNVDNNWKLTGIKYNNTELRNEVIKLINNDTIEFKTHLKAENVISELKNKGLTEEAAKLEALNSNGQNKVIDILSFNDFHGSALESGKNIGAAKLAGVIKSYQAKESDSYGVIPVCGGDSFQGSAISNLTEGEPVIEMMKAIGLQVSAVGNHEFDWGKGNLLKWQKEGNFDFLAANMVDEKTGKTDEDVKAYRIIEKNGVKVAFIGIATEETLTSTKAENIEGLRFDDPVETLKKYIPIVKSEGADVVVALTHSGAEQDSTGKITGEAADIANAGVEGLDAIVAAHSHKFVSGKVNNVPIVQAGYNGRGLSKLSFTFDNNNNLVSVEPETTKFQGNEASLPVDKDVETKINEIQNNLGSILDQYVTTLDKRLSHDERYSSVTELGVKVSETMRRLADTDVAVTNGGGIRRSLEAGKVTVGDMYEILPFDNYIETVELKGSDLRDVIQHGINPEGIGWGQFAGIKVYYDKDTYKINDITLSDGTPIEDDKYYTVAINDFMATGGDGYDFSKAKSIVNTNICMRDGIQDYWKENGVPDVETDLLIEGNKPASDANEGDNKEDNVNKPDDNNNDMMDNSANDMEDNSNAAVGDNESSDNAKTSDNSKTLAISLLALLVIAGASLKASAKKKEA